MCTAFSSPENGQCLLQRREFCLLGADVDKVLQRREFCLLGLRVLFLRADVDKDLVIKIRART